MTRNPEREYEERERLERELRYDEYKRAAKQQGKQFATDTAQKIAGTAKDKKL